MISGNSEFVVMFIIPNYNRRRNRIILITYVQLLFCFLSKKEVLINFHCCFINLPNACNNSLFDGYLAFLLQVHQLILRIPGLLIGDLVLHSKKR